MSEETELLELLPSFKKNVMKSIYTHNNHPEKFVKQNFPPSSWSRISICGNYIYIYYYHYKYILMALRSKEIIFTDFPFRHTFVTTLILGLNNIFGDDNVNLTPNGIRINNLQILDQEFPPELVSIFEINNNKLLIPMVYLPLFYDYFEETFPLYLPVASLSGRKVAMCLTKVSRYSWTWYKGDQIVANIRNDDNPEVMISLMNIILRDLGIPTQIIRHYNELKIRNASKHYIQLWNQRNKSENPLYQMENKFNLESDLLLKGFIPIKDIIEIIKDYNNIITVRNIL